MLCAVVSIMHYHIYKPGRVHWGSLVAVQLAMINLTASTFLATPGQIHNDYIHQELCVPLLEDFQNSQIRPAYRVKPYTNMLENIPCRRGHI